jgi:hypothetical protein
MADAKPPVCEICQSGVPEGAFQEAVLETLVEQTAPLSVCPACWGVYNFIPNGTDCLDYGREIGSSENNFEFALEFPVTDEVDGAIASLTGTLCGDCAAHLGVNILFNGINCREEPHERPLAAPDCSEPTANHAAERSRRDYRTERSVR